MPPAGWPARRVATLRRRLLEWYDVHGRDLPWREAPSPYGAWIAEMMLQQTTVAAAAPYWRRFLARFPDVQALAAAPESAVLALWAGLGYYRRARDLHAAARLIAARDGGRLPDRFVQWLALPGIGRYSAGAIASIAGGERVPAVDANARRVLLRWLCDSPTAAARMTPRDLQEAAARLVPPDRPGDWNQALMDLATAICRPTAPACPACPVARLCRARAAGQAEAVPAAVPRHTPTRVRLGLLVATRGAAVLLLPPGASPQGAAPPGTLIRRGEFGSLYRGLWGLPSTPWYADPPAATDTRDAAARFAREVAEAWVGWLARAVGEQAAAVRPCGTFVHTVTTFRLTVSVARVDCHARARLAGPARSGGWWTPGTESRPLSGLARKGLRAAGVVSG